MFGICNLAIVPLRLEPSDRSELTSQVLFGDYFTILEQTQNWSRIELAFDRYTGWIDNKQFRVISESEYNTLSNSPMVLNGDLLEYISTPDNLLTTIPLGADITFLNNPALNTENFLFEGLRAQGVTGRQNLLQTAFMYLNAPYLWGGKTPFGIDCSGIYSIEKRKNFFFIFRNDGFTMF